MKLFKNLCIVAVIAMLVLGLCACGDQSQAGNESPNADYKVTVADALGTPYTSGVIVRFMQGETVVAMQPVNAEGVAVKNLKKDNYAVELLFTGDESGYYYNKEGLTLTATTTELSVVLSIKAGVNMADLYIGEKDPVTGQDVPTQVYALTTGSTYVELKAGERNYVLFSPTEAGTYKIGSTNPNAKIGYYGAPHYIQKETTAEVVDNAFTVSISAGMIGTNNTGTTTLVIGIDLENGATDTIITIQRTGAPQHTIEDEPWTIYQPSVQLSNYVLAAGSNLVDFDLKTASVSLVYNETDGFYHLNDANGPVVLVRLSVDSQYLASFKTILETSPVNRYFFDAEGNFVKKESYSECLLQYIAVADTYAGVYPLTKDLEYIIKNRGEYSGWFDPTNSLYLFKDELGLPITGINNELAWLFMCCYAA